MDGISIMSERSQFTSEIEGLPSWLVDPVCFAPGLVDPSWSLALRGGFLRLRWPGLITLHLRHFPFSSLSVCVDRIRCVAKVLCIA